MLTVLKYFVPSIKDYYYGIMVDYYIEMSNYCCNHNKLKEAAQWSKLACKYLLKRLDIWNRKLGS